MTVFDVTTKLSWDWLTTPSVLREAWCRNRLGIKFTEEILLFSESSDVIGVDLKKVTEKIESTFGTPGTLALWREHAARNDKAWYLSNLAPVTRGLQPSGPARRMPTTTGGVNVEVEAYYSEYGNCHYSCTERRTYSVEVPFDVIQAAIENEDPSEIEEWIDDNFWDFDTADSDTFDFEHEEYDPSGSDYEEMSTCTSDMAQDLYDRYLDEFTPEEDDDE